MGLIIALLQAPNSLIMLVFYTYNNIDHEIMKIIAARDQIWEFTRNEIIHSFGCKCKSFLKTFDNFNEMCFVA